MSGLARPVTIRPGRLEDADAVLALLDGAVRWLASTGRGGQWGTGPFSAEPERVAQVHRWAAGGGLRIAEVDGLPVGAMVLGEAPAHVPAADGPEVYVLLLVASRDHTGQGVGAALLRHAQAGGALLGRFGVRVDCWAGGDGALVHYQAAGFTATARFTVGAWEGRVLERPVEAMLGGP